MIARLFIGLVEIDGLSPSLSADLFRRFPVVLMTFPITFLCKLNPSSSSPLVAGVFAVEPVLLLEKGTEETLGEVEVVEASKRSAAVFLVYLVMVPQSPHGWCWQDKKLTVVYSQNRWDEEKKKSG